VHPILHDRRALLAYVATWLALAYVPASMLAPPGGGRFLTALAASVVPSLLFGLGTLPLYYLCQAVPLRPASVGRVLRLQLGLALVWSLAWLVLLALAARIADGVAPTGMAGEVERRWGPLVGVGAVLYLAVIAFHYLVASTRRARASEQRAAAASLQLREAQLSLLKAQVHPHFLFNSLNAISALTVADPRVARQLCVLLADFLRGSLAMGARGLVTLAEELELARTYLDIERIRLGDRLAVEIRVTPPAGEARIPALLLQPLVENAITHGIAGSAKGGTLSIDARTTPAMLVVTLTNPFDPQAPPRRGPRGGVGLANVSRRLSASYQGASLTTHRDADRFTSTLVLPVRLEETPDDEPLRSAQGADRR
jgi:two-component system, LytTR family, sensor histidine kinase AlgZ